MKAKKTTTPRERFFTSTGIAPDESWRALFYAPRAFKDYGKVVKTVRDLYRMLIGSPVTFSAKFVSVSYFDRDKKPTTIFNKKNLPFRADVLIAGEDGTQLKVVSFGNVWQWHDIAKHAPIMVHGEISEFNGQVQIQAPLRIPSYLAGKVVPIYPSIRSRITAEDVQAVISMEYAAGDNPARAAQAIIDEMGLPAAHVERRTGLSIHNLLRAIHRPSSVEEGEGALEALVLLSADYIKRVGQEASKKHENPRSRLIIERSVMLDVIASTRKHYGLTEDQKTAIKEILQDVVSPYPANRLLSGDVGTGKTLTFLIPAMIVAKAGYRSAIMAPNELIARQIADEVEKICPELRVQVVNGKTKKLDPQAILIGTTAILSRAKKDNLSISFMAVDEQHKFSREQREAIRSFDTNFVEATATAIPRTMALVTHAGMSVSLLRERPCQRQIISTVVAGSERRVVLMNYLSKVMNTPGEQVAIVYAAVEESKDKINVETAANMWEKQFPGKVAMLHGKMRPEEKTEIIQAFRSGQKQLLVSSSVIEVGVSLPSLRGVIVINAECYGAAQLHQLRGRAARNGGVGHAFFYVPGKADEISPDIITRLKRIANTDDGFLLAEVDLEDRGFGDLDSDSSRQNGTSIGLFMNIKVRPGDLKSAVDITSSEISKPTPSRRPEKNT